MTVVDYSYLWDGTAVGDATQAPYNASEFNAWITAALAAKDSGIYVIPMIGEDLWGEPAGEGTLSGFRVHSGAAIFKGFLYVSDDNADYTVTPNVNVSYHRYDSLVLEIDYEAKKVRQVYLQGTEKSSFPPDAPTLIQTEGVRWQAELFRIYINNTVGNYVIANGFITDQRNFLETFEDGDNYNENLVRNSEFMAFSGAATAGVDAPEFWDVVGPPSAVVSAAALTPMTRGRSIDVTNGGISQAILVHAGQKTFSVHGLIQVVSGMVPVTLTATRTNGLAASRSWSFTVRTTGVVQEYRGVITFEEDDLLYLTLTVGASGITAQFYVGQALVVVGHQPGPYREASEVIPFRNFVTDASWDGDAKSSGTTTIALAASFGANVILPYTRAIFIQTFARDSGSAGSADNYMRFSHPAAAGVIYGELQLAREQNDFFKALALMIPVDLDLHLTNATTVRFNIVIGATGAATFDAFVNIIGILT